MHIKKLNEKLSKLLEDGFALSGKRDEVTDIISKLSQEYGDLTIPEFIDLMIKKEEQGEDILDESLNEVTGVEGYIQKFKQAVQKRFNNFPIDVDLNDSVMHNYYHIDINDGDTFVVKPIGIDGIYVTCKIPEKNGIKDPYGFNVNITGDGSYYGYKDSNVSRWFSSGFKDSVRQVAKKHNIETKSEDHSIYGCYCRFTTYCECDDSKTFKQSCTEILDLIEEILNEYNSLAVKRVTTTMEKKQQATNEFEELAKARREARANRNAKNTTVKQALSKSAVAKKIQALQNPTPEQLAKILAAIDE